MQALSSRCLAVLTLLSSLAAQALPTEARLAVRFAEDAAGAVFRRCEPARLGTDPYLDVVALVERGGALELVWMPAPAQFTLVVPIVTGVRDFAVLPGAGANGDDAVLVLREDGLQWFECIAGGNHLQERAAGADASWAGCTCLGVGADGAGQRWLFGASPGSPLVRRVRWNGTAWVAGAPIVAVSGATQILTLDWDGAGLHEVVLRYENLVFVLTWDGMPFYGLEYPVPPADGHNLLGVIPASGAEPDLLAAFGWMPPGVIGPTATYALLVQRAGVAQMVPFADAAASLAVADLTGDGLVDLVLGDAATSRVELVRRLPSEGGGWPLQRTGHYALVVGEDRPDGAVDALVAGDLDADGDADLVGVQNAHHLHHFVAGAAVRARPPHVRIPIAPLPSPAGDGGGWEMVVPVEVTLPVGWQEFAAPGETLAVDATCWLQSSGETRPSAAPAFTTQPLVPGASQVAVALVLVGDDLALPDWRLWIHARLVAIGPSRTRPLPATLLHFSRDEATAEGRAAVVHGDLHGVDLTSPGLDGGDGNVINGGDPNRDPGDPPPSTHPQP